MGMYVNVTSRGAMGTSFGSKCDCLISDGAKEIKEPKSFQKNLVCVINNGHFGAASFVNTESLFLTIKQSKDLRAKRWFIWDKVQEYAI